MVLVDALERVDVTEATMTTRKNAAATEIPMHGRHRQSEVQLVMGEVARERARFGGGWDHFSDDLRFALVAAAVAGRLACRVDANSTDAEAARCGRALDRCWDVLLDVRASGWREPMRELR